MVWPSESTAVAPREAVPAEATMLGVAEAVTVNVCAGEAGCTVSVLAALTDTQGQYHLQVAVSVSVIVRLVLPVFAGAR
jgi:hypothetical protein